MLTARHSVIIRWAKSRQTPKPLSNASFAVHHDPVLPVRYSRWFHTQSWIATPSSKVRGRSPNNRHASALSTSDWQ